MGNVGPPIAHTRVRRRLSECPNIWPPLKNPESLNYPSISYKSPILGKKKHTLWRTQMVNLLKNTIIILGVPKEVQTLFPPSASNHRIKSIIHPLTTCNRSNPNLIYPLLRIPKICVSRAS